MKEHLWAVVLVLVLAAAVLLGCMSPAPEGRVSGIQNVSQPTVPGEGTPAADISEAWYHEPPNGTPNAALLAGAKVLMKNIYTLTPGSPDYLPGSYAAQKPDQTDYVIHAREKTVVVWPAAGNTQLVWVSEPRGTPSGWSGTITMAGPAGTGHRADPVTVKTDCSGFVTSLFAYADAVTPAKFTGWKAGALVPQAGCFNPAGTCRTPNPQNYYRFFTTGENNWFRNVSLTGLQPGDLIAYANTKDRSDSGHIMIVTAVSPMDDTGSRNVVVIDETGSPHGSDTRRVASAGKGLGMGIIRLAPSGNGTVRFFWNSSHAVPQAGPAVIGRA